MLAAGLMVGALTQTASAQDCCEGKQKGYPYFFLGVQGGAQVTFTDYKADKLVTPIGAVSVGGMFTPGIGARIHVSGINNKGGLKGLGQTYDFKSVTSNLDLMINLSHLFAPGKEHPLNLYLIGGAGLGYAWDNDDVNALAPSAAAQNLNLRWDNDRLVHNFRTGLQLEANLSRSVALNLEVTANNYHDRFNSKLNGKGDWQVQGLVGLTFKLGSCKATKAAVVAPAPAPVAEAPKQEAPVVVETPAPAPEPAPGLVPGEKPAVAAPAETKLEVFFDLSQTQVTGAGQAKVAEFAEWMKNHPTANAVITGYADAGTGNAGINRVLSEKRVIAVTKMLVEQYGISASRLSSDFKGDTEQPFRKNDMNRVVIATAKEQR